MHHDALEVHGAAFHTQLNFVKSFGAADVNVVVIDVSVNVSAAEIDPVLGEHWASKQRESEERSNCPGQGFS